MKHPHRGFTLIEVAICMVILGLAKAAAFAAAYLASGTRRGSWKAKVTANWRIALGGLAPNGLIAHHGGVGPS